VHSGSSGAPLYNGGEFSLEVVSAHVTMGKQVDFIMMHIIGAIPYL